MHSHRLRGDDGQLGVGALGEEDVDEDEVPCVTVPRLVQSLVGNKVVAVAASGAHTAVCTANGELYTFVWSHAG